MEEDNPAVAARAIKALSQLKKFIPNTRLIPIATRLLALFRAKNEDIASEAVKSFCSIGALLPPKQQGAFIDMQLNMTEEKSKKLRTRAIKGFTAFVDKVTKENRMIIMARLKELSKDSGQQVRRESAKSMSVFLTKAPKTEQSSVIERILEMTRDVKEKVRENAVVTLGELEGISTSQLGTVVMALLDLCEDETLHKGSSNDTGYDLHNDVGNSLYKLSKRGNLGKSIPKEQRRHVVKQVVELDAKGWLFHVVWDESGHTAYDSYVYQRAVPLLPEFRGLFSGMQKSKIYLKLLNLLSRKNV